MRMLLSLIFIVGFALAQDAQNANEGALDLAPQNPDSATTDSAKTDLVNNVANAVEVNPDDKLRDDIVTFDREKHVPGNAKIDDPFIYVYPKSEEDLANILEIQNAVLVLNGIFQSDQAIKAKINNTWVEVGDTISGWKVSSITMDKVSLEFSKQKKDLYVYTQNDNFEIKE